MLWMCWSKKVQYVSKIYISFLVFSLLYTDSWVSLDLYVSIKTTTTTTLLYIIIKSHGSYTHIFRITSLALGQSRDFQITSLALGQSRDFRITSLALGQSRDCPSASEAILKNMGRINWYQGKFAISSEIKISFFQKCFQYILNTMLATFVEGPMS